MILYSPDWTNIGFSFMLLTVNLFRHSTLTEHGLYIGVALIFTNNKTDLFLYITHLYSPIDTNNFNTQYIFVNQKC